MCRTGMCRFGIGNWIFLIASVHLFTYVQGGDEEGIRFTVEPADAVAAAGEPVWLACSARGAALAWRHRAAAPPARDDALSADDAHRRQLANGSLFIPSMSAALAGYYQCVASAPGVGTVVSRQAMLFLAEIPPFVPGPRSILGVAGSPALLPCALAAPARLALRLSGPAAAPERRVYSAARLYASPPVLKLNVTWLRNGSPVPLEAARVSVAPGGALELDPLRPHDAARYRCRVSTPHDHRVSEEIELRVSTEAANVESPPRFVATPRSVTVIEGASVTLECAAVGNPKPEMIWLNNGVAIDLNDLDSRFYLAGSGSLRVQAARALDAGAYTCRATSRLDSADTTAHLTVLTAPRVSLPEGGAATARTRGDVTLRCEARGRPPPAVLWLKDGEPLSPNDHDIAIVDGSSLRIQGVLRVDAGMFQCAAQSPAGSAVAAVRLRVHHAQDDLPASPDSSKSLSSKNSTQHIFNSLVSDTEDPSADPAEEELDFLGETSSAYTSEPLSYEYDDYFHAAKELDLDESSKENGTIVSPPRGLRAVIVKHRFVTLSWQEPERSLQDVSGYAVVYRVKGSARERVARGGAGRLEMNVAALRPNTTYLFAARALCAGAVSPPTETIEVTTSGEESLYGAPSAVRAEPAGSHALRVSWRPPAGAAPPAYTVHYTELESGREQVVTVPADTAGGAGGAGGAELSAVVEGLRAAAAYSVVVAASGGGGSAAVAARTPAGPPAAPPGNVSALCTEPTTILVRWEAPPPRTHRGALTGYKVRYRAAGTRGKAESLTTPADARRAELRGLDTETTYQIRVCAINANGSGPFSEWLTAATQPRAAAVARVPPQPRPLTARAGRDWISVWWAAGSEDAAGASGAAGAEAAAGVSGVSGYRLGWGLGVPDEHARELPAHTTHHVIRGLESNSEYVISLHASNALGAGPPVYATVRTKPAALEGDDLDDDDEEADDADDADDDDDEEERPPLIPPVGLKVIMLSGTTAVVYWTDPTLPKGQAATDGRLYVVRWAAAGGRARTFNASDLNCMLDDLKPFTHYEFAVKLIKGGQESSWSMLVANTTLEAAPGSAPRDLRLAPAAPPAHPARAVDLAWAPPARPNGVITGYVVMYAPTSSEPADWTALSVASVPSDRPRARVERLRPRTTYSFKLQARNSKGLGPASAPVTYTTPVDTGGGGLAGATSAWLWASAGGACAVLALAAALALSLCCRRAPPRSPHTSTYQKSSASAGIKPPDLWIHHDQMELKHMDKSLHSSASKISAGSVDGPGALVSSTLTLGRAAAEYEPARHNPHNPHNPPASLDRRHYVPTYVDRRSPSCAGGSDDTAVLRASPFSADSCRRCDRCEYTTMTGMGVGVGVGVGVGAACAATCDRRTLAHARAAHLAHPDQSTPLLGAVGPLGSPQSSLASLHPLHPPPPPCGSGSCPLGAGCGAAGGPGVGAGGDIYACAARERGHYVAYEPLGHYTHRDSINSESGGLPAPASMSSLSRDGVLPGVPGVPGVPGAGGSLSRRAAAAPLHSFGDSPHSTPSHGQGSVRETSPYKKSASSSPGHAANRLQLGGGGGGSMAQCAAELEPLTPSRSTERLQREMQNLEGLMKDLSAITQQQFHC